MNETILAGEDAVHGFFHVYSDGKLSSTLFRCDEDYIRALNLIPQCLAKSGCRILAFTFTGTHFHMMISGTEHQLVKLISMYRSLILKYLAAAGNKIGSGNLSVSYKEMETVTQLKKVICYIIRNSLDVSKIIMPSYYRWGSGALYFADYRQLMSEGIELSAMSVHSRQRLLRTKAIFPDSWRVSVDGLILPVHYVDYKSVNLLFRTANAMIAFMHFRAEDEAVIKRYMVARLVNALSDDELRKKVARLSEDLFSKKPELLIVNEKVALASFLKKDYPSSELARLFDLSPKIVAEL